MEVCCCESDSVSVGVLPPCLTLHCHNAPATDQHDDHYIHDLPNVYALIMKHLSPHIVAVYRIYAMKRENFDTVDATVVEYI